MEQANDRQVGGDHYAAKVQHWDFAVDTLRNRYLEGQITRYFRWRKKGGTEDLRKALHYFDKLIEVAKAGKVRPMLDPRYHDFGERAEQVRGATRYAEANDLTTEETAVAIGLATWSTVLMLEGVREQLEAFTLGAEANEASRGRYIGLDRGAGDSPLSEQPGATNETAPLSQEEVAFFKHANSDYS